MDVGLDLVNIQKKRLPERKHRVLRIIAHVASVRRKPYHLRSFHCFLKHPNRVIRRFIKHSGVP